MIKMINKIDICECIYNFDTFNSEIHFRGKNLIICNFEPPDSESWQHH